MSKTLRIGFFLLVATLMSCKTKGIVAESAATKPIAAANIAKANSDLIKPFSTSSIRGQAKYEDSRNSQNVSLDIRLKKEEILSVSVRVLGITMAKAQITNEGVQYYEKIDNTFFEGSFEALQQWLGLPLNFDHLQRLLLGQPIVPLNANGISLIQNEWHQLSQNSDLGQLHFSFESKHFLLKEQRIIDPINQRFLTVSYPSYQGTTKGLLPKSIHIQAMQKGENISIRIEYQQMNFNEELSFPYKVPNGSKQVFLE